MRTFILATVSAVSMTAGNALYVNRAQAVPMFNGLQDAAPASNIENVQFFFGGRRYRWCPGGQWPRAQAAVQVVTKLAVGTEKIARSKRASSRPHHDRERL